MISIPRVGIPRRRVASHFEYSTSLKQIDMENREENRNVHHFQIIFPSFAVFHEAAGTRNWGYQLSHVKPWADGCHHFGIWSETSRTVAYAMRQDAVYGSTFCLSPLKSSRVAKAGAVTGIFKD